MSARRALITGIAGQDGSLLAELLLGQGYQVFGSVRGDPHGHYENLDCVHGHVELISLDLLDRHSVSQAFAACAPHEVYNLASPSFSPASWEEPVHTARVTAIGVATLLDALRHEAPATRFYQASSSEIFGEPQETPQSESTPLAPLTPYGAAKAYAHLMVNIYRRRYGLFACSGVLYNHESPRRPTWFLPRKISRAAAAISLGLETEVTLGDLDAQRDWGFASDYVRAMWLMLQQAEAGDYVIATGESHTVRELAEWAFAHVGLDWRDFVRVDETLKRSSAELHRRVGDPTKARSVLGWRPTVTLSELVGLMVDADLEALERQPVASSS